MELAKREFDIPLVVRPEDLSSPDLDELSGMTYLSYFMKVDSPGYHATLNMVRRLLKKGTVNNFTVRNEEKLRDPSFISSFLTQRQIWIEQRYMYVIWVINLSPFYSFQNYGGIRLRITKCVYVGVLISMCVCVLVSKPCK